MTLFVYIFYVNIPVVVAELSPRRFLSLDNFVNLRIINC